MFNSTGWGPRFGLLAMTYGNMDPMVWRMVPCVFGRAIFIHRQALVGPAHVLLFLTLHDFTL